MLKKVITDSQLRCNSKSYFYPSPHPQSRSKTDEHTTTSKFLFTMMHTHILYCTLIIKNVKFINYKLVVFGICSSILHYHFYPSGFQFSFDMSLRSLLNKVLFISLPFIVYHSTCVVILKYGNTNSW